jgi:hypothetical protein
MVSIGLDIIGIVNFRFPRVDFRETSLRLVISEYCGDNSTSPKARLSLNIVSLHELLYGSMAA